MDLPSARPRRAATACCAASAWRCYVESSGVAPSRFAAALGARVGFFEAAQIRVQPDGSVQALLGTHNHGQGHATTFAQIISSRLGVPLAQIEIIEGDTDQVPYGTGTFGSRSIAVGGSALDRAAVQDHRQGQAHRGASARSRRDRYRDSATAGSQSPAPIVACTCSEVARAAYVPANYPLETLEPGLQETAVYDPPAFAFSNGAHVCEVEVDPETGAIRLVGYWAVDDIGTVINPMIVEGQIHGGLAQGLGQAMCEHCVYDGGSGQLAVGLVHGLRACRAPAICPTSSPNSTRASPAPTIRSAPRAAARPARSARRRRSSAPCSMRCAPLGVTDIEMPLTPARVWQAIRKAQR